MCLSLFLLPFIIVEVIMKSNWYLWRPTTCIHLFDMWWCKCGSSTNICLKTVALQTSIWCVMVHTYYLSLSIFTHTHTHTHTHMWEEVNWIQQNVCRNGKNRRKIYVWWFFYCANTFQLEGFVLNLKISFQNYFCMRNNYNR